MTKKQNRVRGFGKRSLSVLLTTLIVLSTMVVMLTSTMLTANAGYGNTDITEWYVACPLNSWLDNGLDSDYKLTYNSSSGQWEGRIPPVVASMAFKLRPKKDNGSLEWVGISGNDPIALGSYPVLDWNSGAKDIRLKDGGGMSVSNPEYLTFYVKNDSDGWHLSVTADAWNTAGNNHGGHTYNAPAAVAPGNTEAVGNQTIFWAKATYYDYLSDWEHDVTSWLKPIKAGTGFTWSNDDWYPFYGFNRSVVKPYADNGWTTPLYFGNFCYTYDNDGHAYSSSGHHPGTSAGESSNGFLDATNNYNVTNFRYAVNNSNKENKNGSIGGQGLQNRNQSYQGLMSSHLGSNGELLIAGTSTETPYFNTTALGSYANTVTSAFPFRVTDNGAYKTYQFNSTNGTDNVYFNWENDSSLNSTKPTSVHYGGTDRRIADGLKDFLGNEGPGYGIFPFNGGTGTKTNANNNLDYGFGVKMEVQFRVPKPNATTGVNTESNPITFDFSGDDDLWMYITDNETGDSYLVLDMGGNHKMSHGSVNFNTLKSKVDHVYQGNTTADGSTEWRFSEDIGLDFDYNKTYTMTVFYMERGLIESNCEMTFSMYPAGNQVNVEKEVNTASINRTADSTALQDAVAAADTFNFTAYESDSENGTNTAKANTEYMHSDEGNKTTDGSGSFSLKDEKSASFMSQYTTNHYVVIQESAPTSGKLAYTTEWEVTDPQDSSRNRTEQSGSTTAKMQLKHYPNADPNEYAQLNYKFINTPATGSVSVTKRVESTNGEDLNKEFDATVTVSLNGTSGPFRAYPLTYQSSDNPTRTFETDANGRLAEGAKLKHGRTLTFSNLPAKAVVRVVENLSSEESELYSCSYQNNINKIAVPANNTSSITVINTPIPVGSIVGEGIEATKLLDGKPYTGDMFRFVMEGVPRFEGDADSIIDTSATHMETQTVTNGEFSFDDLTFDKAGVYRYHVYEDMNYLTDLDDANSNASSFHTDFVCRSEFLVSITVTESNHTLNAGEPVFYSYSSINHTMSSADFDERNIAQKIEISNTLNTGNITIEKENQKGEPVSGVTFAVYKVNEVMDGYIRNRNLSDSDKYDILLMQIYFSDEDLLVGTGTTDDSGTAHINGIPIYQDGFVNNIQSSDGNGVTVESGDFTGYQKYVLMELASDGTNGYSLNKTVGSLNGTVTPSNVFSFPTNGQYNFTFEYINNQLKSPSTAGLGMTLFKLLGIGIAALAMLSLGGYILYTKKFAKRKTAKHYIDN